MSSAARTPAPAGPGLLNPCREAPTPPAPSIGRGPDPATVQDSAHFGRPSPVVPTRRRHPAAPPAPALVTRAREDDTNPGRGELPPDTGPGRGDGAHGGGWPGSPLRTLPCALPRAPCPAGPPRPRRDSPSCPPPRLGSARASRDRRVYLSGGAAASPRPVPSLSFSAAATMMCGAPSAAQPATAETQNIADQVGGPRGRAVGGPAFASGRGRGCWTGEAAWAPLRPRGGRTRR
ncbi:hypothetical protein P7K49_032479, partial [Saguinus oedipus]